MPKRTTQALTPNVRYPRSFVVPIGGKVLDPTVGVISVASLVAESCKMLNGAARCANMRLVLALTHTSLLGLKRSYATATVRLILVFSIQTLAFAITKT